MRIPPVVLLAIACSGWFGPASTRRVGGNPWAMRYTAARMARSLRCRRRRPAGRSSHHWLISSGMTQPVQVVRPATVWVKACSLPPKVVSSSGDSTMIYTMTHTRFVMIDMVSAKLRIIHLRCSANRRGPSLAESSDGEQQQQ